MVAVTRLTRRLFIVLYGLLGTAYAQDVFDVARIMESGDRLEAGKRMYRDVMIKLSPSEVETGLDDLSEQARHAGDRQLEVYALKWKGDYYSLDEHKEKTKLLSAYRIAIAKAEDYDLQLLKAILTHDLGMHLYNMDDFPQAFEYLLNAHYLMKSIGFTNMHDVTRYIYDIGFAYYYFTDFKQAISYLTLALQYPFPDHRVLINTYNTLALSYQNLRKEELSAYFFRKALETAKENADSAWIGIASGNLGNLYQVQGYYSLARPLIMTDYELSMGHDQWESAFNSLVALAQIDLAEGLVKDARNKLDTAQSLLSEIHPAIHSFQEYYRCRAEIYSALGDFNTAYRFMDTANRYRDSLIAKNDLNILTRSELKVETERYMAEMKLLDSEKHKERVMRNGIILLAFLLLVISYLLFNRQRLKIKKDNQIISLEKQKAEEELRNAELQLNTYMQSLLEKNQLIDKFKDEIDELRSSNPEISAEKEQILNELYHATILTENDWSEFKRLFEKVHKDFFGKLKLKYPELTVAETRLLALVKLRLSNDEMARMLGISGPSVRKTSLRLRKKLDMIGQTDLTEMVEAI